jgi:catechol 2,3-dioxygenase-like lactoylglutathione lyase family enzyme
MRCWGGLLARLRHREADRERGVPPGHQPLGAGAPPAQRVTVGLRLSVTVDVPDIEAGLAFYGGVFGFAEVARPSRPMPCSRPRVRPSASCKRPKGSAATPAPGTERNYARHWTPVHLDLHVEDWRRRWKPSRGLAEVEQRHEAPGARPSPSAATPSGKRLLRARPRRGRDAARPASPQRSGPGRLSEILVCRDAEVAEPARRCGGWSAPTWRSWGGYTGLWAAKTLAEGGLKPVVLEAHRVGWGASGRKAGRRHGLQLAPGEARGGGSAATRARAVWDIAEEASGSFATSAPRGARGALPARRGAWGVLRGRGAGGARERRALAQAYGYDAIEVLDREAFRAW